jgi:hypothetical protein
MNKCKYKILILNFIQALDVNPTKENTPKIMTMNTQGGDARTTSQKKKVGDIKPRPSGTVVEHLQKITPIMNIDEITMSMMGRNTLSLPTGGNVILHQKREYFINQILTYPYVINRRKSRVY